MSFDQKELGGSDSIMLLLKSSYKANNIAETGVSLFVVVGKASRPYLDKIDTMLQGIK
jgi:hypothetical protein